MECWPLDTRSKALASMMAGPGGNVGGLVVELVGVLGLVYVAV